MENLMLVLCVFLLKSASGENISITTAFPLADPTTTSAAAATINSTTSTVLLATTEIPCNGTPNLCPLSQGLVCVEGLCKCAYPHLSYDNKRKRCIAKVGEQCGFFIGLQNSSTVGCPPNAICNVLDTRNPDKYDTFLCGCIYNFYHKGNGECAPLPKHSESCEKVPCHPDADLSCINGTCQCRFPEDQYFDPRLGACVSYAGGNCTRLCVPKAICDWGTGTCQCRLDHRINKSTRQCELIPPGYLSPCLGESQLSCNSEMNLNCIDSVCQCRQPLHQTFDFRKEKCVGLAGDICDPKLEDNCVQNSKCTESVGDSGERKKYVCNCLPGFSSTPTRTCMKSYGQNCSNEFCNLYRGLACINGKCQCYDSFLNYHLGSETCESSSGSPCGKIFVPFPGDWMKGQCSECDSYFFACDSKSTCSRDFSQGSEIGTLERFRCVLKQEGSLGQT